MARRHLVLACVVGAIGSGACGAIFGIDEDEPIPDRGSFDGGGGDGDGDTADGRRDVGEDASDDADAGSCTATGAFDPDPSFVAPSIPFASAKGALDADGRFVTIGRIDCDGGTGLSMSRIEPDGGADPTVPTCFGAGSREDVVSVAPSSNGWIVATNHTSGGLFHARVARFGAGGETLASSELSGITGYASSYSTFAVEAAGQIVWGGYRYSQGGQPDRGFLTVVGGGSAVVPDDEVPASAAVSGGRLYVASVSAPSDGGTREVVVRRYDVVGKTLVLDGTFGTGGAARVVAAASAAQLDGRGSLLVEGDAVTVAAPNGGGAISVLRFSGGSWSSHTVAGYPPAHVQRSCDGTLVVGLTGPASLVALPGDGGAGVHLLPQNVPVISLARDPEGRLYVAQGPGASVKLTRVLP